MLWPRAVFVVSISIVLAACGSSPATRVDAGEPTDAGDAQTPICTPGTVRCVGEAGVEVCREDGSSYVPSTSCEGATPVCLDGACVVCTPGTSVCSDAGSTQSCLANGTYGDVVMCDAATPICMDGACLACEPGSTICEGDGSTKTCLANGSGYAAPVACEGATPACHEGTCVTCVPGTTRCVDDVTVETCAPDGSAYVTPTTCDEVDACREGACVSRCALAEASPSSIGCSFFTAKLDSFASNVYDADIDDALVVVNPDPDQAVDAELYFVPNDANVEQSVETAHIDARGHHAFRLSNHEVDTVSWLRAGGVYRVRTTRPVAAFHHAPIVDTASVRETMLLLPEHTLTGHYVVASYPSTVNAFASYFTAIALADDTTLTYRVPQDAAAGMGVPAIAAGGTGMLDLARYDFLNVVAGTPIGGDLSGTIVEASGPLWLVGGTECANVPDQHTLYCNVLAEQMVPLEYWGTRYVTARPPGRPTSEERILRVYAGADDVTVSTTPAQPGFPVTLDQGAFVQLSTNENVVLTGDGPFMTVQYLRGTAGLGSGDPAMTLAVPTAQFLDAYAFVASSAFVDDYAQVIRGVGEDEVLIDGVVVTGYETVGEFEVASVLVEEGTHLATSASPFGLYLFSHDANKSFACPGGMALRTLNPQ